jgi:hypothetical protein
MKHEMTGKGSESNLSYECNGCGQCFENMERLRQHGVDCKDDDEFESSVEW